ncbi:MAG: hypothetical protein ACYC7F_10780 [Gemmatimonadaceae bacterium]
MNQPLLQMDLRLVGGAIVVLAGAVIAILLVRRRLFGDLPSARGASGATLPGPSISPQVVKELQARGLATPAQLANMTEMERQLLFSTMASAISRPADDAERLPGAGARNVVSIEELPPIHCPLCGYRIEQFTSTPPITGKCETCGAKVVVRRDAARILLTVLAPQARHDARLQRDNL